MNNLKQALNDYLTVRRALGYKLEDTEYRLRSLVVYLERAGAPTVTTALALAWAKSPPNAHASYWGSKMTVARGFARYLQTMNPATEVPPDDLLPWICRRATPYLYTDRDVQSLLTATLALGGALRAVTYETLIGLLVVTGLRVGEALNLDRDDVDLREGVLTVRHSKFGKSRELVLQPTTTEALAAYANQRNHLHPQPVGPSFFVSATGKRLHYWSVQRTFQDLVRESGLERRSPNCRPRLHDFRHSFAVNTLLDWYRDGGDVQSRLPLLSTYLGHVDPANTYWYLSAAPELMALVAKRLETSQGDLP